MKKTQRKNPSTTTGSVQTGDPASIGILAAALGGSIAACGSVGVRRKVNHLGIKDTATIQYMKQNEIFADAFNFFAYDGRQVIDPNSLVELDTREIGVPYGGEAGAEQPVQRTRDIAKSVTAMTDRRNAYMVLAIENQSNIHYAMPVKDMVSDSYSMRSRWRGQSLLTRLLEIIRAQEAMSIYRVL